MTYTLIQTNSLVDKLLASLSDAFKALRPVYINRIFLTGRFIATN